MIDAAERPAARQHAAAIALGELRVPIDGQAGRRAAADLHQPLDVVEHPLRPVPTPLPALQHPAVVHPLGDVEQPVRGVPRQVMIAFAVGIDREQLPERVEIAVVRIAKAVGEDFRLSSRRAKTARPRRSAAASPASRASRRGSRSRRHRCRRSHRSSHRVRGRCRWRRVRDAAVSPNFRASHRPRRPVRVAQQHQRVVAGASRSSPRKSMP